METPRTTSMKDEEPSWEELLGSKNWDGLLNPLNLSLRRFTLRCGDFCQATYDAFDNDKNSKYAGSSRYGKKSFFHKVILESAADYEVYSFLYATTSKIEIRNEVFVQSTSLESWDKESNWIGYIAVTTDEVSRTLGRREIYVAWRGTIRSSEWLNDLDARPASIQQLLRPENGGSKTENIKSSSSSIGEDNEPKVMNGWLSIYVSDNPNSAFTKLSARAQIQKKIQELREIYKNENLSITLTGHSLGACLAILSAFDLAENGVDDIPVAAVVFCSPKVGNNAFKDRVLQLPNLKILHIKNKNDLIPRYPGIILNFGYTNIGTELVMDCRKSPSLKDSKNPSDWHNLQALLHVVAGWNGDEGEFELKVKRSLALVNKSCDILKDECLIPASWWIEKNKGMVVDENGEWILSPPSDEDKPVPEFR